MTCKVCKVGVGGWCHVEGLGPGPYETSVRRKTGNMIRMAVPSLIRSTPVFTRGNSDHKAGHPAMHMCNLSRVYCTIEIATLHIRTPEITMIPPRRQKKKRKRQTTNGGIVYFFKTSSTHDRTIGRKGME